MGWFVSVAGSVTGPHPAEHVVAWVATGQIPVDAQVWAEGGSGWTPVPDAWSTLAAGRPWPFAAGPAPAPAGTPPAATAASPAASPAAAPSSPSPSSPPRRAPGAGSWLVHLVTDRFADFAGVDHLQGFKFGELMSAVFHRYSRDEIEEHFATGLPTTTPSVNEIAAGWPKPWMFVRLLGGSSLLFLAFLVLTRVFDNPNLLPGLIVVGSFAVPLSVLVFFFEVNSPRNVSLYLVLRCMMAGGVISLGLTLIFGQATGWAGRLLDPILTGVVEESAKLLAVYLITFRLPAQRYPWILNGMLFGAAIGAGFACFESAGYALRFLITENGVDLAGATEVIVIRGLLAPFGHVVWTALAAGALWRVKLDQKLVPQMLVHKRVLKMLLVVMVLHAVWDVTMFEPPFLLKYLLLGVVAWFLAFGMLVHGLKQIKAAQTTVTGGLSQLSGATVVLRTAGTIG